jgi:hypothetical protein
MLVRVGNPGQGPDGVAVAGRQGRLAHLPAPAVPGPGGRLPGRGPGALPPHHHHQPQHQARDQGGHRHRQVSVANLRRFNPDSDPDSFLNKL